LAKPSSLADQRPDFDCSPRTAGGPEHLRIILEGESLLNDASSFTLFSIFIAFVVNAAESETGTLNASAGAIIWKILWKMVWLAVGAFLVGFRIQGQVQLPPVTTLA